MTKGRGVNRLAILVGIFFAAAQCLFAAQDPFLTLDSVIQTNGQFQFNLNGEDGVSYVIEGSSDLQNWTPVLTNNDQPSIRTITVGASNNLGFYRASRGLLPLFSGALTARSNITFLGNSVTVDSFDSSDTNDFPGGQYNDTNRYANGNVASGYGLVSVGNGAVIGKVFTGPTGSVTVGANGMVGDVAFYTNGNTGIEPGWHISDYRFCLPDVQVPYTNGLPLPPVVTNTYILSSGQYLVNGDLSSFGPNLLVTGQVVLYVTGGFTFSRASSINIQSNASLTLFVGGSAASLNAINNNGSALSFQYYGLSGNTFFTWASASDVVGTVYAPEATMRLQTAAPASYTDFSGSFVGNSITISGETYLHYDENLAKAGPQR